MYDLSLATSLAKQVYVWLTRLFGSGAPSPTILLPPRYVELNFPSVQFFCSYSKTHQQTCCFSGSPQHKPNPVTRLATPGVAGARRIRAGLDRDPAWLRPRYNSYVFDFLTWHSGRLDIVWDVKLVKRHTAAMYRSVCVLVVYCWCAHLGLRRRRFFAVPRRHHWPSQTSTVFCGFCLRSAGRRFGATRILPPLTLPRIGRTANQLAYPQARDHWHMESTHYGTSHHIHLSLSHTSLSYT